ncbi:MAG: hypothetical protein R3E51_16475 [Rhizobiaceae bacterium]
MLQAVSDDDLSNIAFPFLTARDIEVGNSRALAVRIGYVGELGYELYVEQEYAAHVYEALREAGEAHGIADAGYRAVEHCRLEKGYLYWSGDITPDYNPYEAGLGFAIALEKGDFIGRAALAKIRAEGVKRKLCSFTIDGFAPLHGGEAILLNDKVIGSTSSTGHTASSPERRSLSATSRSDCGPYRLHDRGVRQRRTRHSAGRVCSTMQGWRRLKA